MKRSNDLGQTENTSRNFHARKTPPKVVLVAGGGEWKGRVGVVGFYESVADESYLLPKDSTQNIRHGRSQFNVHTNGRTWNMWLSVFHDGHPCKH